MTGLLPELQPSRVHSRTRRRSRIIDAASTIARTGGYEAAAMRAIARDADVSTGTLYRYFPSKHHLLVAVLSDWLGHFDAWVESEYYHLEDPFARLRAVTDALYGALYRRPLLAEAMARAYAVADATLAAQVDDVHAQLTDLFTTALGDGTGQYGVIGAVLSDVWAANVLALSHDRVSLAELRTRLATTVRLLSRKP